MQGKIIEVIHIAKTYRTTARRNRCSADNRHTLHTRSYGGFEKIKAAVPYTFDKGVTPLYVDTAALGRGRRETGEVSTKYDQSLLAEKILTGDQYLPAVEQALSWSARK